MLGIVLLRRDFGDHRRIPPRGPGNHRLAMMFALAAIGMFFIALTTAYVVSRGQAEEWQPLPMPRILLATTVALLLSSLTLEKGRLALRDGSRRGAATWITLTLVLGLGFLFGQLLGWRMLAAHGFFLSTNAHSSFFYLFTGLHGLHLAGGLFALAWSAVLAGRDPVARAGHWVDSTALYWHSMDGLWVFLMLLLFVWA